MQPVKNALLAVAIIVIAILSINVYNLDKERNRLRTDLTSNLTEQNARQKEVRDQEEQERKDEIKRQNERIAGIMAEIAEANKPVLETSALTVVLFPNKEGFTAKTRVANRPTRFERWEYPSRHKPHEHSDQVNRMIGQFFDIEGVVSVSFIDYEISIRKADKFPLDEIRGPVLAILQAEFPEPAPPIEETKQVPAPAAEGPEVPRSNT